MTKRNLKLPKLTGGMSVHRNNLVMSFLRTMLLLTVMVCGAGNVALGQDATFNMGQATADITVNGCKLTFAGGGIDDVNTQDGVTTLSTKTVDEVKTSASMTLTGKNIRYIKITFADDENTYKLKWGGSWNETINANNDVSGKGTLILVSNSGPNNFKIINDIEKGTESTPIKKVEVYYWNAGYTSTGDQTAANATKTISNAITWENNTVDLSKINVVGTYASFGTNGKGAMLKNSADNYLSIKFEEPADLSGISYFRIDGENVDKTKDPHVFDSAQFICDDGNGGTVNVDKYNNPANVDFTGDGNADQRAKLAKVKEIRLYNNNCEGTFSINSIKFIYQYTLTWVNNEIPTGCDAWYTIGSDPTQYKGTSKVIEAGTEVTFHGTDTGDDHKMINGWYNPNGEYWGWGATKAITVSSDFSVKPDFQPCFRVFANAENGATATVTGGSGKKYFQKASGLSFSTTVPDGYTFDGWYADGEKKGTTNPWNYGDYTSSTTDLTLTAKFAPIESNGIVTFSSDNNEMGTVTATVAASAINSGDNVTGGSTVTFTATPSGSNVFWRWQEYREGAWYDIGGATATYEKRIDGNFQIKAIFSEPKTFTASTPLSTYGNVKITKNGADQGTSYTSAPYPQGVKFVATANANYSFVAWYSDETLKTKVSEDATFDFSSTSGNTGIKNNGGTLYAKFVRSTGVTPNPDSGFCGGKNFDLSTLQANRGATLNSETSTVTIGSSGGSVSLYFAEPINLSEIYKWTLKFGDDQNANFSNIAFRKNGETVKDFWSNAIDRVVEEVNKPALASIDEIRINLVANTTTNIESFYFELRPDVKYKKPTLASPTEETMLLFEGETLKLRITDTNGYWREFTNDTYTAETTEHGVSGYVSSYDITGLTKGDYYFGIKHGGNCKLGHYHTTDLVKVRVHVIQSKDINTINVNGTDRQYDVYKPEGLTSSSTDKVGVVVSLHGASKDYYDDSGRINFNAIADAKKTDNDKKFVVVYPRGIMRELRGQERGWATYNEDNVEDVEFFKAMVNEINSKDNGLTVDFDRVYLAGYANGGMMAYKAAHQAADFFKAFASVGGFPVNESHLYHAGSQPTPFIHIQGEDDEIFNETTYSFRTISQNMTYRNGAKFNPYDSEGNDLSDGGVVACTDKSKVIREIHPADATGSAAYFLYTIKNMTHVPAYNWDGVDGDDVAQSIWNFFDYSGKVNSTPDKTLKFKMYDPDELWTIATTSKSSKNAEVGYIGFDNVNTGTSVLSYGGRRKTGSGSGTYDKDTNNNNIWHSLQFNGGVNGATHFMKLNVETDVETTEEYFLVKLTRIDKEKDDKNVTIFSKRYQAGRGKKDLYINFTALAGFNEYKLEITRSKPTLAVAVHGVEVYSGKCSDKDQEENPVFYTDVKTIVSGLKPIYQPVYGTTFDGLAKEYLPIANIPIGEIEETHAATNTTRHYKVIENDLKVNEVSPTGGKLPSQWGATTEQITVTGTGYKNLYVSGRGTDENTSRKVDNIAYILGSNSYTVDPVKGINISQHGRAQMVDYLNGTVGAFPTKGMLAIKFEGTCDFTLLAENDIPYTDNGNNGRSTLKVYYTNDQLDGELKELKEWWFYGTRSEVGGNDNINKGPKGNETGNSLNVLSANIRLPQLGKDGTCTVFITYEGRGQHEGPFTHESGDNDKIWIKGFVIKRPDLKVTIGRTDSKYAGQNRGGEENTKLTRFGENKPYIWSFENVGFNNTRRRTVNEKLEDDTQEKKVNVNDWRTYVCGGTDDSFDHLLVYSNINSSSKDDKAQFDGRVAGQEHIEFRKPSDYTMKDPKTGRQEFNPITSNGLKVNVTGSGWFKIKCSAPNGPVNMKVYSSTNYGISYTNLLREFVVDNSKHPESATREEEHKWGEYTVYLKGHVERAWAADKDKKLDGFWDGDKNKFSEDDAEKADEKVRMSLYVVFDKIDDETYTEDGDGSTPATPQLNIHQLSWLNEEPADYVFQREEDPKLLTTWQAIRRDGDGNKTLDDSSDNNVVLYWMAGTDKKEKHDGNFIDTYNRLGQMTTNISGSKGVKSPGVYASTSVPSDAGTYDAYWDIAAPALTNAHTEKAYANQGYDYQSGTEYTYTTANGGNTEFDMPISGSFIRICAMKNTYVVAHVLPGATNGAVYVLDETGSPIPLVLSGEPSSDAKRLGYITSLSNIGADKEGGKTTSDGTIRIDFKANAGKEYFICAKDASISLARLEIHDWRHKPAKAGEKLEVADNTTTNSTTITSAYDDAVAHDTYYRDANLTRTFAAEKWASLVLPFSLNEKKFEKIFGKNAKVLHFTDFDGNTCTLKFTRHFYNIIVAGRPVFVWPTKEVTNPDFNDITLQTKTVRNTVTPSGFSFVGSYDNADILKNDLYMNNNNVIKYINKNSTYPGMRSFIKNNGHYDFFTETPVAAGVKAVLLSFDDDEPDMPTGIEELVSAEFGEDVVVVTKTTKIYDLLGNVIGEGSDIKNLPTGVYIVNGKKYYVK